MLKRLIAVSLFGFLFTTAAFSQNKNEKAVADAVEVMRKAMIDADKAALENIALNELSYGHSGGKVEDKKMFVENIVNGNSDFVDISLTEQKITMSGNTAIVRHRLTANTNDKGKGPGKVDLYILLVWKKQHGWKLLARQAVKVPQ